MIIKFNAYCFEIIHIDSNYDFPQFCNKVFQAFLHLFTNETPVSAQNNSFRKCLKMTFSPQAVWWFKMPEMKFVHEGSGKNFKLKKCEMHVTRV